MQSTATAIELVKAWIAQVRRVVVLTGAGISTDSGIPDFRGPHGVWTRNPAAEAQSTLQTYLADPLVRQAAWRSRMASTMWTAQPNRGHLALVALERRGKLHALITQNIDELHQIAGNSAERVIEVHGTARRVMCWQCGERSPMHDALQRVRDGEQDPACRRCGGILKSDTISFGQPLIPQVIDRAMGAAASADCLLAIGTSLQVYPIAAAVPAAKDAGATIIIVNAQPTPFDAIADLTIDDPISEVLPKVCRCELEG